MSARELLLIRDEHAFALEDGGLPELEGELALQDSIAPIRAAAERIAGRPLTLTMRLLDGRANLSVLQSDPPAGGASWRSLDELSAYLGAARARAVQGAAGAPWYRLDFHQRLLDFASAHLAERGIALIGRPEQVRVSPLSCIYRLPAGGESYWVKAARPHAFAPEGRIMAALHESFPDLVPAPLAFEHEWVLFPDFGTRLEQETPVAELAPVLASFARLQTGADHLLELPGLQSWRLAEVSAALASSRGVLGPDADALLEQVEHDVAELSRIGIGDHLVHGDFYWGNVARRDGRIRIFDWADAGVGHPFFDPLDALIRRDPELERAYLDVWRRHCDADIDAAWQLASRLAAANHVARNTGLLSRLQPYERPSCEPGQRFFADRLCAGYGLAVAGT